MWGYYHFEVTTMKQLTWQLTLLTNYRIKIEFFVQYDKFFWGFRKIYIKSSLAKGRETTWNPANLKVAGTFSLQLIMPAKSVVLNNHTALLGPNQDLFSIINTAVNSQLFTLILWIVNFDGKQLDIFYNIYKNTYYLH